ncbi:unnamed protein product, partial [Phaeothamnion confervicola]
MAAWAWGFGGPTAFDAMDEDMGTPGGGSAGGAPWAAADVYRAPTKRQLEYGDDGESVGEADGSAAEGYGVITRIKRLKLSKVAAPPPMGPAQQLLPHATGLTPAAPQPQGRQNSFGAEWQTDAAEHLQPGPHSQQEHYAQQLQQQEQQRRRTPNHAFQHPLEV